jgi:ATP-dependent RNA helicase DDX41
MEEDDERGVYIPLKQRRALEEAKRAARRGLPPPPPSGTAVAPTAANGSTAADPAVYDFGPGARAGESLFDQARRATEAGEAPTELDKMKQQERDLMAQVSQVQVHSLISAKEYAEGIKYTAPLKTDWRPPRHLREMTREQCDVRPAFLASRTPRIIYRDSLLYHARASSS